MPPWVPMQHYRRFRPRPSSLSGPDVSHDKWAMLIDAFTLKSQSPGFGRHDAGQGLPYRYWKQASPDKIFIYPLFAWQKSALEQNYRYASPYVWNTPCHYLSKKYASSSILCNLICDTVGLSSSAMKSSVSFSGDYIVMAIIIMPQHAKLEISVLSHRISSQWIMAYLPRFTYASK